MSCEPGGDWNESKDRREWSGLVECNCDMVELVRVYCGRVVITY